MAANGEEIKVVFTPFGLSSEIDPKTGKLGLQLPDIQKQNAASPVPMLVGNKFTRFLLGAAIPLNVPTTDPATQEITHQKFTFIGADHFGRTAAPSLPEGGNVTLSRYFGTNVNSSGILFYGIKTFLDSSGNLQVSHYIDRDVRPPVGPSNPVGWSPTTFPAAWVTGVPVETMGEGDVQIPPLPPPSGFTGMVGALWSSVTGLFASNPTRGVGRGESASRREGLLGGWIERTSAGTNDQATEAGAMGESHQGQSSVGNGGTPATALPTSNPVVQVPGTAARGGFLASLFSHDGLGDGEYPLDESGRVEAGVAESMRGEPGGFPTLGQLGLGEAVDRGGFLNNLGNSMRGWGIFRTGRNFSGFCYCSEWK